MKELEKKRLYKRAERLLDRANELLNNVCSACSKKYKKKERKAA